MKKIVTIRIIILLLIIIFVLASLVHFGILIGGYEHDKARVAELIIAVILAIGFITGIINPAAAEKAARITLWIALAGTLIGLFTIIIGVGLQSSLDLVLHSVMILLLGLGLIFTKKKN